MKLNKPLSVICVTFLVTIAAAMPGYCQTTFGSITGTVIDASGAVVPGVSVVVTNVGTNIANSAETNSSGNYTVPELKPGTYQVTASKAGFKRFVSQDVNLSATATVRVNVQLEVGSARTTVSVTAGAPVIHTDTPTLSSTIPQQKLLDMPLNLISIAGGTGDSGIFQYLYTVPSGYQAGGARYSLGGARGSEVYYNVDGISSNSPAFGNYAGNIMPSNESVQEVHINMVDNKAEYAQVATVSVVTKSGTNHYHGQLVWNNYNTALGARSFFATNRGTNIENDGVASLGGPIKRNKAFFFGTYEFVRQRTPAIITDSLPTLKMRNGDFSEVSTPIINPYTGAQFPGNLITPSDLLSSVSLKYQNMFYPNPNYGPSDSYVTNFRNTYPQKIRHDEFDVRVDYQVTPKNSFFVRFSYKRDQPQVLDSNLPPEITGYRVQVRNARQAVFSDTWTLTPDLLNVFTAGFARNLNDFGGELKGQALIDTLGIQGLPPAPADVANIPNVSISGFTTLGQLSRAREAENTFQFLDQMTYIRGRHTFKAGMEYRPQEYNQPIFPTFGSYDFSNQFTGFPYADFLLGLPTTTGFSSVRPPKYARFYFLNWFVQDDFKITRKLTLSYGLRWDYYKPAVDKYNVISNFDPANGALVVPTESVIQRYVSPLFPSNVPIVTAQQAGFPTHSLRNGDANNFEPRFGFAYRPFGGSRTVIRGGYGIYDDEFTADIMSHLYGGPFGVSETFNNAITNGIPALTFQQPFQTQGTIGALSVSALNKNLFSPYVQQWNLTVEHDIGFSTALRLSYVGTKATNLVYGRNINQPPASTLPDPASRFPYPLYESVTMYANGGNQNYQALTTEVQRKWSKGLSFDAAWTWSKNITDDDEISGVESGIVIEDAFNRERQRGNALYSPRHRFVSNIMWDLPMGTGKPFLSSPGALNRVVGGWQLGVVFLAQTGQFLTPSFSGSDPSHTLTFGGIPECVGNPVLPSGQRSIQNWFDPSALAVPPDGSFGNCGTGIIEGPGNWIVNTGLAKTVNLTEHVTLRLSGSFTNIFNHPNFGNPNLNMSVPARVGTIDSVQTRGFVGPRNGMLSVRLDF